MCDRLSEFDHAFRRYAAEFDPERLTGDEAARVVRLSDAVEKMAGTVKALAARRAAETGAWKGSGARSAAAELAKATGTTVSVAAEALETAHRLEGLPALSAAARRGELSAPQAAAIANAAGADPGAESRLVDLARRSSLGELRDECARVKAAAIDPEARRQQIHRTRYLRSYVDADGAWNLRMRDNPEVGAEVMAALEPIRDKLFAKARQEGRREPPEAYGADALVTLARGEQVGPVRRGGTKVIVRVDLAALLRGRPAEGEVCEVAGFGPVAVSAIRDLIDSGDPFLASVVTKGHAVVGVAHSWPPPERCAADGPPMALSDVCG